MELTKRQNGDNLLRKITGSTKDQGFKNSDEVFGDKYNTDILPGKYFFNLYNEIYDTYSLHAKVQIQDFLTLLFKRYKLSAADYIYKFEHADDEELKQVNYESSEFLIKVKDKLLLYIGNESFKFWYSKDIPFVEIEKIIGIVEKCKEKIDYKKKFYMVVANQNSDFGFELQQFDINFQKLDIEMNYNEDFPDTHKLITSFLCRESDHGLILLHGKYGTGKTSYLRYLISKINKRVIFLPLELMDSISSPNFLPFMAQYKDSVLILEDCEELLRPRDSGILRPSIANLLNLGDGLIADALSIKIICTFNADLKFIDKAILRKGRLVARYEFNDLEPEKANKLAKKLGLDMTFDEPIPLSDIYNFQQQDFNFHKPNDIRRLGY